MLAFTPLEIQALLESSIIAFLFCVFFHDFPNISLASVDPVVNILGAVTFHDLSMTKAERQKKYQPADATVSGMA